MKKIVISLLGGLMVLAGLLFIVIPGPALIFIVPGLLLLSIEYSWAESWLRKTMKLMRHAARALDKALWKRKHSRNY